MILLLLFAFSLISSATCSQPSPKFGSKTSYVLVENRDITSLENIEGCHAVQFWHLLRHGALAPTPAELEKIKIKIPALKNKIQSVLHSKDVRLARRDINKIMAWELPQKMSKNPNHMTKQGEKDLYNIGRRYKERFPTLFDSQDIPLDFKFLTTESKSTHMSATSYAEGMFGSSAATLIKPIPDKQLVHSVCGQSYNTDGQRKILEFKRSEIMNKTLAKASRRLGLREILDFDEVDLMWDLCRYERAWRPSAPSHWCAPFDTDDLSVLEYYSDMKSYFRNSYGNEDNRKLGCNMVKRLIDHFSSHENVSVSTMYFVHKVQLERTIALLGINRDEEPITAQNYERMKTQRKWITSDTVPFGGNLAAVLYECPTGEKYRLKMWLNEKPVRPEGCKNSSGLCSWKEFQQYFQDSASNCSCGTKKRLKRMIYPTPSTPRRPSPSPGMLGLWPRPTPSRPTPGRPTPPRPGYPSPGPGYPSPGYPGYPSPGYPGYPPSPSPGYPGYPSPGYPGYPSPGPGYPNYPGQPGRPGGRPNNGVAISSSLAVIASCVISLYLHSVFSIFK